MTNFAEKLAATVGIANLFTGDAIEARYRSDISGRSVSDPGYVVRPRNAAEVAAILRTANEAGIGVTTQGGRTGTVKGAVPDAGAIVISLERMTAIEELDPLSMTITVEAGATLQAVHEAVEAVGLLLPLDIGARGSATIGGVISTNAGGVLSSRSRHMTSAGNARAPVSTCG
jgi:FAD/FMN-containing dehydrogenase